MRTTDWAWLLLLVLAWPAHGAGPGEPAIPPPAGSFSDSTCIACHADHDAQRMLAHLAGPHRATGCSACHGDRHGRLTEARADTACTGCHDGVVADSHANSKHGVLLRIAPPDLSAPLRRGNYRAPNCAYCHLHDGEHGDRMDPAPGMDSIAWVCGGCHSSRFALAQLQAGVRLVAVAEMKLREATDLAGCLPRGDTRRDALMASVRRHARNVRLGAGHHSPDYQWWYGQPALDGDLIRLRDLAETRRRVAAVTGQGGRASAPAPLHLPDGTCGPR